MFCVYVYICVCIYIYIYIYIYTCIHIATLMSCICSPQPIRHAVPSRYPAYDLDPGAQQINRECDRFPY